MKKIGANDPRQALAELKLRGEYRNFAILRRKPESPTQASLYGYAGLSAEAIGDKSDVNAVPDRGVSVWCSNDYLGMSRHPVVINAMKDALDRSGAGAGGTRNISGTNIYHVALEQELADLHNKEAALIFTSGYNANQAALSVLGCYLKNCIIYSDRLNHASMIAGIRASKTTCKIWEHNNVDQLRKMLEQAPKDHARLIALESVYSMDADIGPIKEVCDLAEEFGAHVYLDEVHAVGMYGTGGAGVASQIGQDSRIDIIQGTLGKAFGIQGGYIAGSRVLIDLVRSFAPDFIFSTALSPVLAAGALASIRHLRKSNIEREGQRSSVEFVKNILRQKSIPFYGDSTHIVPVIVPGAAACVSAARALMSDWDIYVQPIVYPTVPRGTERLRLTPSPQHSPEAAIALGHALASVLKTDQVKAVKSHVG